MKKKAVLVVFVAMLLFSTKNIKAASSVGTVLANINEVPDKHTLFGEASYLDKGYAETISRLKETKYNNTYMDLDKYVYVIFKYDSILNIPVKRYDDSRIYLPKGNTMTLNYSVTKNTTSTFEREMSNTVEYTLSAEQKAGFQVDDFANFESKINSSVKSAMTTSIKNQNSYSVTKGFSISTTVNQKNYDSFWIYEERANFNVYQIRTYEINYKQNSTKHKYWWGKTYYTCTYEKISYTLVNDSYTYRYIDGSKTRGFSECVPGSDGKYKYAGDQVPSWTYLV